jgi:hypothetical protein
VISLFNEHVPGIGYVESSSDIRRSLAKESHSFVCEKCGPIKNILKIRKPVQSVLPVLLPKPIPFVTQDNLKISEATSFNEQPK